MADYGTLFQLILAALTFVIIGMFFIVYLMIVGLRQENRLRARERVSAEKEPMHECVHFFGYLIEYPKNLPIPEECFGCVKTIECMNGQKDNVVEVADSASH